MPVLVDKDLLTLVNCIERDDAVGRSIRECI